MIIKKSDNGYFFYQGAGVHPLSTGCIEEGREQCTCLYHITDGTTQYDFEEYASAEKQWCILTGEEPFRLGKDKWS